VAGIRHRRAVLSLRLTGRRDALVVSMFEPQPVDWRQQQQQQQRRRRNGAGVAPRWRSPPGSPPPPDMAGLHTACVKEVLAHCGATDAGGRRVAERLSADRLAATAGLVAASFEAGSAGGSVVLPGATPAAISAAAWAVRAGRRPARAGAWSLTVLPAAPHPLDLAATTAALCLLADAVRAEPVGLEVACLDASGWGAGDARHPSSDAPRLWGLVLRRWAQAVWSNGTLARLEVGLPPAAAVRPADVEALAAAGRDAAPARRLAVACAGHRKAAGVCAMYVLPLEVLGAIVDCAAPERGCEVVVLSGGGDCGGGRGS
jgi:hypothetical protein